MGWEEPLSLPAGPGHDEDIKAQGFMSRGGTKQNELGVALGLALGFQDLQP